MIKYLAMIFCGFCSFSLGSSYVKCPDGSACPDRHHCCEKGIRYSCCKEYYDCCDKGLRCCPKIRYNQFLAFLEERNDKIINSEFSIVKDNSTLLIDNKFINNPYAIPEENFNITNSYESSRATTNCINEIETIIVNIIQTFKNLTSQNLTNVEFLIKLTSELSELVHQSKKFLASCENVSNDWIKLFRKTTQFKIQEGYWQQVFENSEKLQQMKILINDLIANSNEKNFSQCGITLDHLFTAIFII